MSARPLQFMCRLAALVLGGLCLTAPAGALPIDQDDRLQARGIFTPFWFAEIQDIDLVGDLAYLWGVGGLAVMDISDIDAPAVLGRYEPPGDPYERYYRGAVADGLAVGGAREDLLHVFDVTDPFTPRIVTVHGSPGHSYEGAALRDSLAYACRHGNGLEIVDLHDPANPVTLGEVPLVNAWDVALQGDLAYVADGAGGLAVVDVTDPANPFLVTRVDTWGSANDVEVDGGLVAVTGGSAGLSLFTLDDPRAPVFAANANTSGLAIGVSLTDGLAYVADWDDVETFSVTDPANPVPVGGENTPVRAMGLAARPNLVVVADWSRLRCYTPGQTPFGDVEIPETGLDFGVVPLGSFKDLTLTLGNTGSGPVTLTGIFEYGDNFEILTPVAGVIPVGGTFDVTVRFTPAFVGHDASFLDIQSDDSDESSVLVSLNADNEPVGLDVGDMAPDFTLQDMDGVSHNLFSYRGKVVILAFFANW